MTTPDPVSAHLASPDPESQAPWIRGRSPVTDRSRSQRSTSRVRLSCVPVILLADCWIIMGFAAVLRIYKFWLNYWFTICPNNFTKFVCMHQFERGHSLKTSVWKQGIEVYFRLDLWLNVFSWHFWSLFRAMLLFPWMFWIVMTRIMDLRSLFCTPSIFIDHAEMTKARSKEKRRNWNCHGACLVLWKLKRFAIIELDAGNVNLDGV